MANTFGERLKDIRIKKGITQQKLAEEVFTTRSTLANWETGRRIPDIMTIKRLADYLEIDVRILLGDVSSQSEKVEIIILDDERFSLSDSISVLEKALPEASIIGFTKTKEAIEYCRHIKVDIAFLDIEIGVPSGLDVCKQLLMINPKTNIVFLTAFEKYAFNAWDAGACGFLLKPLTIKDVHHQLTLLRHPISY